MMRKDGRLKVWLVEYGLGFGIPFAAAVLSAILLNKVRLAILSDTQAVGNRLVALKAGMVFGFVFVIFMVQGLIRNEIVRSKIYRKYANRE